MNALRWTIVLAASATLAAAGPAAEPLQAQRQPAGDGSRSVGYFMVGWHGIDLGELNAALTGAGYPALPEDHVSFGGGGWRISNRLVIGGEGHGVMGSSRVTANDAYRARLTHGYGLFNIGYVLAESPRVDLIPMVGIGGGGTSLSILDRSAPTFDEALANPARSTQLATGGLLLDASVGVNVRATSRPRRTGSGGLAIGLRAGYTFSPVSTEWRTMAGNDVAGGPDVGLQGVYVKAMVGGWSARSGRTRR